MRCSMCYTTKLFQKTSLGALCFQHQKSNASKETFEKCKYPMSGPDLRTQTEDRFFCRAHNCYLQYYHKRDNYFCPELD